MAEESIEVVLTKSMQPYLVITAHGVFKVKDGKMKELEPDPELGWVNRAFWLSHALDKDFDPAKDIR